MRATSKVMLGCAGPKARLAEPMKAAYQINLSPLYGGPKQTQPTIIVLNLIPRFHNIFLVVVRID